MNKQSIKGTLYVLCSAICFSLGGILIKFIPWSSLSINGVRSFFSFFVILIFQKMMGHRFKINPMVVLGASFNLIMSTTFVMATKMTTAANAIVLQFTEPIFIILLMWIIYKERPKKEAVLTCGMVLMGILCFFYESLSGGGMLGNFLAILSGLSYAGVFLMKKFPDGDFESSLLISHLMSFLIGMPSMVKETESGLQVWMCIVILGIVQYGFSYVFLSMGMNYVSPVTASLTSTIEPILNPILVALFYHEHMGMFSVIGAVLVIGSATGYNLWAARHE